MPCAFLHAVSRVSRAAAVLLAGAAAANAQIVTIDFDDIPGGPAARAVAPDRYQSLGVLLSTTGAGLFAFDDPGEAGTAPTFIYGNQFGSGAGADAPVIVTFVQPGTETPSATSFVSFFVADDPAADTGTYTAEIFNSGGTSLGLIAQTEATGTLSFTRPTADIYRLVFTPSDEFESLDTLRFNALTAGGGVVVAPEPGTAVLLTMMVGLLLLGSLLCRLPPLCLPAIKGVSQSGDSSFF